MQKGFPHAALLVALLAACGAPPTSQPPTSPASNPETPVSTATTPVEIATTPPAPTVAPTPEEPTASIDVAAATGWTMFHGDGKRTGMSTAPALQKPRVAWKAKVGIQSWLNSPITLGKTAVIVPSSGSKHNKPDAGDGVMALDLATGKRAWFTRFAQDANGVAANDAHVFATSDDENLYALALKTGKVAWKTKGSGKMYSHPLVVGDLVVVGDASGIVRGIAAKDGAERWKVQLAGAIRGGASSDGKAVYVASEGGDVAALTTTGKTLWKQAVKRPPFSAGADEAIIVYSPPIVAKDLLIIPFVRDTYYTGQPGLLALDIKSGNVRWRGKGSDDWGNLRLTPVLAAGTLVYAEPYSGDIVGVNARNGTVKYRNEVGPCFFPSWSSPAGAGNLVYVPRFDGSVYAIAPASGKTVWSLFLGDSKRAGSAATTPQPGGPKTGNCSWDVPTTGKPTYSPAAVAEDGTLLVGNEEGFLYALRD
jgi:outer membrane protein assembly factor BamB